MPCDFCNHLETGNCSGAPSKRGYFFRPTLTRNLIGAEEVRNGKYVMQFISTHKPLPQHFRCTNYGSKHSTFYNDCGNKLTDYFRLVFGDSCVLENVDFAQTM